MKYVVEFKDDKRKLAIIDINQEDWQIAKQSLLEDDEFKAGGCELIAFNVESDRDFDVAYNTTREEFQNGKKHKIYGIFDKNHTDETYLIQELGSYKCVPVDYDDSEKQFTCGFDFAYQYIFDNYANLIPKQLLEKLKILDLSLISELYIAYVRQELKEKAETKEKLEKLTVMPFADFEVKHRPKVEEYYFEGKKGAEREAAIEAKLSERYNECLAQFEREKREYNDIIEAGLISLEEFAGSRYWCDLVLDFGNEYPQGLQELERGENMSIYNCSTKTVEEFKKWCGENFIIVPTYFSSTQDGWRVRAVGSGGNCVFIGSRKQLEKNWGELGDTPFTKEFIEKAENNVKAFIKELDALGQGEMYFGKVVTMQLKEGAELSLPDYYADTEADALYQFAMDFANNDFEFPTNTDDDDGDVWDEATVNNVTDFAEEWINVTVYSDTDFDNALRKVLISCVGTPFTNDAKFSIDEIPLKFNYSYDYE